MSRVLVTGATGNLARKLVQFLRGEGHDLTLLCLNPRHEPGVIAADLSRRGSWSEAFEGVDVVLHFAADASPWAGWASLQAGNLDLTANVLEAAQAAQVGRVVFASTNFVMAGYRHGRGPITTDMPPWPVNGYGMTKLAGERMGRLFADWQGLSFIALRIGVCLGTGPNVFSAALPFGRWGQGMWLSDGDLRRGVRAAMTAPDILFGVYNLMSDNPGMRWDLGPARRDLGYDPQDGGAPLDGPLLRLREAGAWLRDRGGPGLLDRIVGREW